MPLDINAFLNFVKLFFKKNKYFFSPYSVIKGFTFILVYDIRARACIKKGFPRLLPYFRLRQNAVAAAQIGFPCFGDVRERQF